MSSAMRTEIFTVILTLGLGLLVHSVFATEYNRVLIFKEPIEGKILPGHVIRTDKVANEGSCRVRCFLEPNCVSINVGRADDQGQRTCELNNFTDESPSQTGLQQKTGHIHYSAENICHSNPCPGRNFICQEGFTAKRYRCVCREGFKGEKCDEEINECRRDTGCGNASSSEATLILTTVSTAYPASTTQPSQQDVSSSSGATEIPIEVSTALPASTSQPPPLVVSSSEATVIPTAVSTTLPASTSQPPPLACQQGWIGNGASCYKLSTSSETWENSKKKCEEWNASLVKVESSEENDFIKTKVLPTESDNYWIGLSDLDREGDWMWTDGTQLDLDGDTNWGPSQPNNVNNNEHCVVIRIIESRPDHYGKWHDLRCLRENKYICEMPKQVDSL